MARLKDKYRAEVMQALQQKFGYKNVMEIPRLEKVVINMGLGDCKDNAKALETAVSELATHLRSEAAGHQGEEVHRELQAALGHERRREGHPARRPHV